MSKESAGLNEGGPATSHVNQLKKNKGASSSDAVEKATKGTNHPDHHSETTSLPESGTNNRSEGKSQPSGAGAGIPPSKKSKGVKPTGVQARAKFFNERSENGGSEKTGGGN